MCCIIPNYLLESAPEFGRGPKSSSVGCQGCTGGLGLTLEELTQSNTIDTTPTIVVTKLTREDFI